MATDTEKLFAKIVLLAMKKHEDSYVVDEETETQMFSRHELDLPDACNEAATELGHPMLGRPVYLMTERWWNDAEAWAQEVLGEGSVV